MGLVRGLRDLGRSNLPLTVSSGTFVNNLYFQYAASNYTFNLNSLLGLLGSGITNNSPSSAPTFIVNSGGTFAHYNGATAFNSTIIANNGGAIYLSGSGNNTLGTSTVTANAGSTTNLYGEWQPEPSGGLDLRGGADADEIGRAHV